MGDKGHQHIDYSCGIDLGDHFVVMGGRADGAGWLATQYNKDGHVENLPRLRMEMKRHACTSYTNAEGNIMLILIGGAHDNDYERPHNETDILDLKNGKEWKRADDLPVATMAFSAVNLHNIIYVFGGYIQGKGVNKKKKTSQIWRMDPKGIKLYDFDDNHDRNKTVIWRKFGKLLERRAYYGVGLIYDVTKYAKWCTEASDI